MMSSPVRWWLFEKRLDLVWSYLLPSNHGNAEHLGS